MLTNNQKNEAETQTNIRLQYIGIAATIAPFAIALLRVARVSDLDPTSLTLLLKTIDIASLVISSLVLTIPFVFVFGVAVSIVIYGAASPENRKTIRRAALTMAIPAAVASSAFLTPQTLAVLGLATVTGLGMWYFTHHLDSRLPPHYRRESRTRRIRSQANFLIVGFLAFTIWPDNMWLPSQNVSYGTNKKTAYVLEESDRFTTLMLAADNRIIVIRSNSITGFEPCTKPREWYERPISSLVFRTNEAALPECKD